jgi:hypothetical protein
MSDAISNLAGDTMEQQLLQGRLETLRIEHRDLDAAIEALREAGVPDQIRLARLKKRKLCLRDEIATIESQLIPDIIA